jgi:hypothetical protein
MKTRSAGQVRKIGLPALIIALAFLTCGAAMASDYERRIQVTRDGTGSDVSLEIQTEGSRSTARPCVHASKETVERVTDRISGKIDTWKASLAGAVPPAIDHGTSDPATSPCSIETLRRRAAGAKLSRRTVDDPGEVTARDVKGFLKGLRASRKGKPAPAVDVSAPERRLGMVATSPGETN